MTARASRDRVRRLQIGVIGIVAVVLVVELASLARDHASNEVPVAGAAAGTVSPDKAAKDASKEPLAELGVAPATPATGATPSHPVKP